MDSILLIGISSDCWNFIFDKGIPERIWWVTKTALSVESCSLPMFLAFALGRNCVNSGVVLFRGG